VSDILGDAHCVLICRWRGAAIIAFGELCFERPLMKLLRLVAVFSIISLALSACSKEKVQQTIDSAKAAASDAGDKAKQQAADAVNQATQAVTEKVKQSASDATNQAIADAKEKAGKAAADAATQTKEALSQAALAARLQAQKSASEAAARVQSQTSTTAPHPPLERTDWQLTRLDGKAVIVNPDRPAPNLILNPGDHRVAGSGGCNRMNGTYQLDGQSLKFGALASTRMACAKGMDQEQSFLQALELVRTWGIKANHLELSGESGDPVAVFEARNTK
jgi:heat shock protein HslJ